MSAQATDQPHQGGVLTAARNAALQPLSAALGEAQVATGSFRPVALQLGILFWSLPISFAISWASELYGPLHPVFKLIHVGAVLSGCYSILSAAGEVRGPSAQKRDGAALSQVAELLAADPPAATSGASDAAPDAALVLPPPTHSLLSCSICLDTFVNPATLPCGHSFCRNACLAPWLRDNASCPECRAPCPPTLPKPSYALSALSRAVRGVTGGAAAAEDAAAALDSFLATPAARLPLERLLRDLSGEENDLAFVDEAARGAWGESLGVVLPAGVELLTILRRMPDVVSLCGCEPPHVTYCGAEGSSDGWDDADEEEDDEDENGDEGEDEGGDDEVDDEDGEDDEYGFEYDEEGDDDEYHEYGAMQGRWFARGGGGGGAQAATPCDDTYRDVIAGFLAAQPACAARLDVVGALVLPAARPSRGALSLSAELAAFSTFTVAGGRVELSLPDPFVCASVPFTVRVTSALAREGGLMPLSRLGSMVPPTSRPSSGRLSLSRELKEYCREVVVEDGWVRW